MSAPDYLGSPSARLVLYLPHLPEGLESFCHAPSAQAIVEANSNHWRKIINLLAKVASPVEQDWRGFRDGPLFERTALCFVPELQAGEEWHWIAGQANLLRFSSLELDACPALEDPEVALDEGRRVLITPYPDYRQISNARVARIRALLERAGFYADRERGAC
ncbi:hypothetical protein MWU49_05135 [Alcanivorax sp. S6407]|uniref:DUF6942 family protein n=1 Tax=Alcanivorax sp. S6407 TaxID=2926424 RepID=UPI001FF26831|nr:hypothetical protein [Alcanivorax sp. S6407]MCK0153077.1 hypothetical protein [Alcanivorax sp. S6407]